MLQYQASLHEGHLEQLLHIIGYLKKHPQLTLYMDLSLPLMNYTRLTAKAKEFQEYYHEATEELPLDQLIAHGRLAVTTASVDALHALNHKSRKSHSEYIIFVNQALILWYCPNGAMCKTWVWGSCGLLFSTIFNLSFSNKGTTLQY